MFKILLKNNKGFTILELIVSIFVMMLAMSLSVGLFTSAVTSFNTIQKRTECQNAASTIITNIRSNIMNSTDVKILKNKEDITNDSEKGAFIGKIDYDGIIWRTGSDDTVLFNSKNLRGIKTKLSFRCDGDTDPDGSNSGYDSYGRYSLLYIDIDFFNPNDNPDDATIKPIYHTESAIYLANISRTIEVPRSRKSFYEEVQAKCEANPTWSTATDTMKNEIEKKAKEDIAKSKPIDLIGSCLQYKIMD